MHKEQDRRQDRGPGPNTKNLAVWNMATAWNAIPDLRAARSEGKAKQVVRKFVKSLPI